MGGGCALLEAQLGGIEETLPWGPAGLFTSWLRCRAVSHPVRWDIFQAPREIQNHEFQDWHALFRTGAEPGPRVGVSATRRTPLEMQQEGEISRGSGVGG